MISSVTEPINWNDGRALILNAGQTAKCENLTSGELYAVLIYNVSQIDVNAAVTVVWSNSQPPSPVTLRGSTGDGAPANFVFVSGTDTDFVSISLGPSSAASIKAFIVSVSMPFNTDGLNNAALSSDGQFHPFDKYTRYYAQATSGWQSITIENLSRQFISLQILQNTAAIIVVNEGAGLADGQVSIFGPTASKAGTVVIDTEKIQNYSGSIEGGSGTWVWMNGDSLQNSQDAKIALQQLSLFSTLLNAARLSRLPKMLGKYFKD